MRTRIAKVSIFIGCQALLVVPFGSMAVASSEKILTKPPLMEFADGSPGAPGKAGNPGSGESPGAGGAGGAGGKAGSGGSGGSGGSAGLPGSGGASDPTTCTKPQCKN